MKNNNLTGFIGKIWELIKKNKFVMVVLVVGLVLILLPTNSPAAKKDAGTLSKTTAAEFSLSDQENRIAAALSQVQGAGKVTVVLTLRCGTEQVLAKDESSQSSTTSGNGNSTEQSSQNTSTTVIISSGSSTQSPVTLKYIYPEYLGALVVAEGANDAAVKLQLIRAVSGLTGLGTDKIVVTKMNKS